MFIVSGSANTQYWTQATAAIAAASKTSRSQLAPPLAAL